MCSCLTVRPAVFLLFCKVHFSSDPWCHPGDSRGLQVPAAPTRGRLSPGQRWGLSGQSRCTLEPRHRHRESSQNGKGPGEGWGEKRKRQGQRERERERESGKLITKERARRSEAVIASESVIKMESDREKGRERRAVLLPLPPDISARSSLKSRPSLP